MAHEQAPLLPSDHHHSLWPHDETTSSSSSTIASARRQTKRFLTSKTGHYSVLALVSLDISSIFAELILQILTCERRVDERDGERALEALGIVSLVFSSLFMLELLASIWSFGARYFRSKFHCLDAAVIVTALVVDILLRGFPLLEEIGSLVIILRLWRVFKIIEELSAGAEEQMEPLRERIEDIEKENHQLRYELDSLRNS